MQKICWKDILSSPSSFPLVMEGNGGWIPAIARTTPNGSAVFTDCVNE